jgi:hypothetical protein
MLQFLSMRKPRSLPSDVTLADLCWLLGVTKQRIGQLEAEGVVEKTAHGRYALTSVPRFIKLQRERGSGPKAWNDARTQLARERAAAAKLARLEREGKMMDSEVVQLLIVANNRVVRDRFLGLGAKIAPIAHAASTVARTCKVIDSGVHEILTELSQSKALLLEKMHREAERRGRRLIVRSAGALDSQDDRDDDAAA